MPDRTPNLLVIGAMKAGTTTICEDLARHRDVWFPESKEPNGLARHLKGEPHALSDWKALYASRSETILGDGSTGNAKVPFNPDCSELAAQMCGSEARIVYITRDPCARIERHVAHEIGNGNVSAFSSDLLARSEYLCPSAYSMQLSFWRKHFADQAILLVTLEDYIADRESVLRRICQHIGIASEDTLSEGPSDANRGDTRRSAHKSWLGPILHSRIYTKLREYLPRRLRRAAAGALLPPASRVEVNLADEDRNWVLYALAELDQLDAPTAEEIEVTIADARRTFELQHSS